jgi:PleD family two-component response regulator
MLYDAIIMSGVIIAIVDDMFFKSKIRAVAEAVGTEISFPRNKDALFQKAREAKPQLIIVDLHNEKIEPATLANELKADEELRSIRLLGFFSHVQTELQRDAIAAGFDQVIPRSVFARDLSKILSV